jgi:hypothetical protein
MTTKEAQKNMANLLAYMKGKGMPKEDRDALPYGTTRTDLLSYAKGYEDAKREAQRKHLEYNKQQLIIADVSHRRELLIAYEKFTNKEAYNDLEQPINKIINKFLTKYCS